MKTLVIKKLADCPFLDSRNAHCLHDKGIGFYHVCGHYDQKGKIPDRCPLREGLTITVEED